MDATTGILIGVTWPSIFFPCLLCATETRRSRFCELGLVSSRKELGELSISLCVLLPCPSTFVRLWAMAQNESYLWLVMMADGVLCFLLIGCLLIWLLTVLDWCVVCYCFVEPGFGKV